LFSRRIVSALGQKTELALFPWLVTGQLNGFYPGRALRRLP
jgi:hypothetical protein